MLPKTDEGQKRIEKYLLENATPEVKPIPKDEPKKKKDDVPDWKDKKNDDFNNYDYSDDKELDDKEW